MWRHSQQLRKKTETFNRWFQELSDNPPDVLLGANFAEYGGVRAHLHAIQKYSTLNIGFAPPDELLSNGLTPYDFNTTFNQNFLDFPAGKIKVGHSHVFPWFIKWCRAQQQHGMRWVHTYHNMYFPEFSATGELEQWQIDVNTALIEDARHADARLSVSRWQQAYLRDEYGIETEYVPNGVDVDICDAGNAERFRKRWNLRHFVLYVGRNDPVKNPADFVRLAHRLPKETFVMIGGGLTAAAIQTDWRLEATLNVRLLGSLSHPEVQDAIAACKIVVVTSKREGLPTLVMEAMAHGKPVVVPDEAGCKEAIGNGEAGYIYTADDIEELARQTRAAMTDDKIGQVGRQRVEQEYDWRDVSKQLGEIYQA
jgi:glycosyltransferase involved in cell wall biosynthesis